MGTTGEGGGGGRTPSDIPGLSLEYKADGVELRHDGHSGFLVIAPPGTRGEPLPGGGLRMRRDAEWYILKVSHAARLKLDPTATERAAAPPAPPGDGVLVPCVVGDNCWVPLGSDPSVQVAGAVAVPSARRG